MAGISWLFSARMLQFFPVSFSFTFICVMYYIAKKVKEKRRRNICRRNPGLGIFLPFWNSWSIVSTGRCLWLDSAVNGSIDSNCMPAISEYNASIFQPLWVGELQTEWSWYSSIPSQHLRNMRENDRCPFRSRSCRAALTAAWTYSSASTEVKKRLAQERTWAHYSTTQFSISPPLRTRAVTNHCFHYWVI